MTYTSPSPTNADAWKQTAADVWSTHAPSANTAAVVTLAAVSDVSRLIDQVIYSYSDLPVGGRLTISDGGETILDVDTDMSGPAALPLHKPIRTLENSTVIVTLAAGGAGVSGKINVQYR